MNFLSTFLALSSVISATAFSATSDPSALHNQGQHRPLALQVYEKLQSLDSEMAERFYAKSIMDLFEEHNVVTDGALGTYYKNVSNISCAADSSRASSAYAAYTCEFSALIESQESDIHQTTVVIEGKSALDLFSFLSVKIPSEISVENETVSLKQLECKGQSAEPNDFSCKFKN